MLPETNELDEDALQDVAYLTRSRNRVRILGSVAETPGTPSEVVDVTGVSRSTLQRILSELDERGWVQRTQEGRYEATPAGTHIVNELVPFVRSIKAIRELDEAVASLPTDSFTVGLEHFTDVAVLEPQPNDPTAPGASFVELIRDTSELRCLVEIAAPVALLTTMRDRAANGALQSEHILSESLVQYIRDSPHRARTWTELTQSGADVFRFDGEIPCNLFILDETVLLGTTPPPGEGCVLIETQRDAVQDWAHGIVDDHRMEADHLIGEGFNSDQTSSSTQV